MGPQFHETEYGRRFFGKQLPDLTKAINRLAEVKEQEIARIGAEKTVVTQEAFDNAKICLIDNGIDEDEANTVLQALCYILCDEETEQYFGK